MAAIAAAIVMFVVHLGIDLLPPMSWHEAAAVITDRVARSRRVKQQGAAIRPGPFAHAGMETRYVMAF
jgi:hypothetical protein